MFFHLLRFLYFNRLTKIVKFIKRISMALFSFHTIQFSALLMFGQRENIIINYRSKKYPLIKIHRNQRITLILI